LGEVELRHRRAHEAARVAGKLLAHQIGAIEGLVKLFDPPHIEAAYDAKQLSASFRSVKKAFRGYREPFVVNPADARDEKLSVDVPITNRSVLASRDNRASVRRKKRRLNRTAVSRQCPEFATGRHVP